MTSACSSSAYRTRTTARFKATTETTYYDARDYSSCLAARQNSHCQSKSLVCVSSASPIVHTEARLRKAAPTHHGATCTPIQEVKHASFLTPQEGKMTHVWSLVPFSILVEHIFVKLTLELQAHRSHLSAQQDHWADPPVNHAKAHGQ